MRFFGEILDKLRHASIQTTMNVYGAAMRETKMAAHSKVVGMLIKKNPEGSISGSLAQEPLSPLGVYGSFDGG